MHLAVDDGEVSLQPLPGLLGRAGPGPGTAALEGPETATPPPTLVNAANQKTSYKLPHLGKAKSKIKKKQAGDGFNNRRTPKTHVFNILNDHHQNFIF